MKSKYCRIACLSLKPVARLCALVGWTIGTITAVQGQVLPRLLLERSPTSIRVTQPSVTNSGALLLLRSTDATFPDDSAEAVILTNGPIGAPLVHTEGVLNAPDSGAYFHSMVIENSSATNFEPALIFGPGSPLTGVLALETFNLNSTGTASGSVRMLLANTNGDRIAFSGDAAVELIDELTEEPIADATFQPRQVRFESGFAEFQGSLSSNASTNEDRTLRVRLLTQSAGLPVDFPRTLTASQKFGLGSGLARDNLRLLTRAQNDQCLDANTAWAFPLQNGTGIRVTGTFGEHRKNSPRYLHPGLDLSPDNPETTQVRASRGGKVLISRRAGDPTLGGIVVINHGDGWYSKYLHLEHTRLRVKAGACIQRGAPLADGLNARQAHLHFETRYLDPSIPLASVAFPGAATDPYQTPARFGLPSPTSKPKIERFGLTSISPRDQAFVPGLRPSPPGSPVYVWLQAVHEEAAPAPKLPPRMGPLYVAFEANQPGSVPVVINPWNADEIEKLRVGGASPYADLGFARYPNSHERAPKLGDRRNYFPYWFRWDTQAYRDEPIGARSFYVEIGNYALEKSLYPFSFGPSISAFRPVAHEVNERGHFQTYELTVDPHLGYSSSTVNLTQSDRYSLTLDGNAVWEGPVSTQTITTPDQTVHRRISSYRFVRPVADQFDVVTIVKSAVTPDISAAYVRPPIDIGRSTVVRIQEADPPGISSPSLPSIEVNVAGPTTITIRGILVWTRSTFPSGEPGSGPIAGAALRAWKDGRLGVIPSTVTSVQPNGVYTTTFSVSDADFPPTATSASLTFWVRFDGGTVPGYSPTFSPAPASLFVVLRRSTVP